MPDFVRSKQPDNHSNPSQSLFFGGALGVQSEQYAKHFCEVCEVSAPEKIYQLAYERWKKGLPIDSSKELRADIRVFIGMSEPSLFETSISLMLPYGVPYVPGSACKGLARRVALKSLSPNLALALFGDDTNKNGVGCVYFHDAWWVPNSAPGSNTSRPLVREVVTPHHKDFMDKRGKAPATPFDSPSPIPQIAAHGKFLFAVEGGPAWTALALNLLKVGLANEGIGARTPEYGTFTWPKEAPPKA